MADETPRANPGTRSRSSRGPGNPRGGPSRDQGTGSGDHRTAKPEILPPRRARLPFRIEVDRDALAAIDKRALAGQIAIGIAAGWLASVALGGSGVLRYAVTGIAGSIVGAFLLERLGLDLGIRNPILSRLATATLGAALVVILARLSA